MPDFVFAQYALAQLLRSLGWPRKAGFLGHKATVEATVVDVCAHELVQIGISLGIGRPALAVRLLADTFQQRDWSGNSATELLDSLDPNERVVANRNQRPCEAIAPPSLAKMGRKSIAWEWLGDSRLAPHFTGAFGQGLIWGLLHPKEAENALNNDRRHYEQRAPFWRAAGAKISPQYAWATNEDFYKNCEEIVESFVSERRPLVNTPQELQLEPRIARRLKGSK
jgi:hypothetical protein